MPLRYFDAMTTDAKSPPPNLLPLALSPAAAALKPKTEAAPRPKTGPVPVEEITQEIGGPKGPEPTRFGDWEKKGRCSDF